MQLGSSSLDGWDMNDGDGTDLRHAISAIERRVRVVRLTPEAAEFLTKTRYWIEIMRLRMGWRIRAYRHGACRERTTRDVASAIEAARSMAMKSGIYGA